MKRKELTEVTDQVTELRAKASQERYKRRQKEARQFPGKRQPKPAIRPTAPPAPAAPIVPVAPEAKK